MVGVRYLLGIALVTAGLVAACGDDPDGGGLGAYTRNGGTNNQDDGDNKVPGTSGTQQTGGQQTGGASTGPGPTPVDTAPAPDTEGKKFFIASVHPSLANTCGTCHETGPGPGWLKKTDAEVSYKMMFQLGYVSLQSRILMKGAHGAAPALTSDQTTKFTQWVNLELKSGGAAKTPNILEKLGACFDKTTFDAMQLGNMRTVRRTDNNNINKVTPWNENANNCTGCDNAPCRTCHSGDDATGFVLASGNPNLPATYTFDQSKMTNPAYLQKYFGISATGEPIASNALKIKSDATSKDKAYSHPYFRIDANMETRITAFVDATISKYKSTNGACGP
jgi:hypothetical protein